MAKASNTVTWFPHIATASGSATLSILQKRFHNDGYAGWFKLLETLCMTENHTLNVSDEIRQEYLADRLGVKVDNLIPFCDLLASLDAIDKELWGYRIIWCQNLVDNIVGVYADRRRVPPQRPTPNLQPSTANIQEDTPDLRTNTAESDVNKGSQTESVVPQPKDTLDLPEWIDKDAWNGYLEMRKKIKKPATVRAMKMVINSLEQLRGQGQDPNKVLDQSTLKNWTDVYELKNDYKPSGNGKHPDTLPTGEELRKSYEER